VILDMVYGYTDSLFSLSYLYREMGFGESPFLGSSPKTSSQRAPTVGGDSQTLFMQS